jgi:heat shock protein HslJ
MITGIFLASVMSLAGSEWGPPRGGDQTVQFDGSTVSGNSGCNRFSGTYVQDGDKLAVGELAVTKMACAPERMEKERQWISMLNRTSEIDVSHLVLILKDGRGAILSRLARRDFD